MAMNVTEIVLKKPVTAHNEMLHVLELREPTYDEIEALGFPFIISG
ncbi:phage tail assembly protein, partial [Shigella sonnei]